VEPRPGVIRLYEEAREAGLKVAVCSAATKSSVILVLENLLGPERFEVLITSNPESQVVMHSSLASRARRRIGSHQPPWPTLTPGTSDDRARISTHCRDGAYSSTFLRSMCTGVTARCAPGAGRLPGGRRRAEEEAGPDHIPPRRGAPRRRPRPVRRHRGQHHRRPGAPLCLRSGPHPDARTDLSVLGTMTSELTAHPSAQSRTLCLLLNDSMSAACLVCRADSVILLFSVPTLKLYQTQAAIGAGMRCIVTWTLNTRCCSCWTCVFQLSGLGAQGVDK